MVDRDMLVQLLNEIEIAARRDGLVAALIEHVERSNQYKSDDRRSWVWRQTAAVTAQFNEFITGGGKVKAGNGALNVIKLNGERALTFEPMKEIIGELEVPEVQSDYSERYLTDWILSLQHSIRSNASFQAGITSDVESNSELGRVLDGLTALLLEGADHAH